jgi:hypothetical protein
MALAQLEETRRKAIRGFLERMEPDTLSVNPLDLWTRQELFGIIATDTERSFQQRCLTRFVSLGVLDALVTRVGSANAKYYALKDSVRVLDALTDDDVLTSLIWQRYGVSDVSPKKATLQNFVPESAPAEEPDAEEALSEMAGSSDEGLQALTLKLLAGLVESLYYVRVKVDDMDNRMSRIEKAVATLTSQFEIVAMEPPTVGTPINGAQKHK